MDNYKGIFYNDSKEQHYYEGGAHFRYKDLYDMLTILGGILPEKDYDIDSVLIIHNNNTNLDNYLNKKKTKNRTRNFNQINYVNNTNTQLTFNKQNLLKNNLNNTSKDLNKIKSRNDKNYFGETNNNYNRTNTSIYKYNQNTIRNNLMQTFLNKKERSNLNKEKKNNDKFNNYKDYINFENFKYIYANNKNLLNNKYFNRKKSLNKLNSKNIPNDNMKSNYIINSYNNNSNKLINIKKDKNELNYLNNKFNIFFPKNNNKINYSRNIENKIIMGCGKSTDNIKNLNFNQNNLNNIIYQKTNNLIHNMKNCSSGINSFNYNKKLIIYGNNLFINKCENKKDININKKNNDLFSQKNYRNKINQLFELNQNMNLNKSKKKSMSRNLNNIFNSQNIKFKTTYAYNVNSNNYNL